MILLKVGADSFGGGIIEGERDELPASGPSDLSFARKNRAGEAVSDIRAVHVLAPSWKEVIESGDSSSATSMNVFLTVKGSSASTGIPAGETGDTENDSKAAARICTPTLSSFSKALLRRDNG
eukprot:CAMPEP_0181431498 /NCGR_PEP_ID=MMETSP1110-20121109/18279_1 /TAXON_ID=174948 /ORGANISM="Symbiodinium sp., Strain CCMP421" /LENGTH=122 /DNA_ID=CAMNT_0023554865 /DNA_START=419 /DNA_END=788 /DNA_ORIENTATION=-